MPGSLSHFQASSKMPIQASVLQIILLFLNPFPGSHRCKENTAIRADLLGTAPCAGSFLLDIER